MSAETPIEDMLNAIAACGYNIALDGPDVTKVNPEYRWTLRGYTNKRDAYDHPEDRQMFHGASASAVLLQMIGWIEHRESP